MDYWHEQIVHSVMSYPNDYVWSASLVDLDNSSLGNSYINCKKYGWQISKQLRFQKIWCDTHQPVYDVCEECSPNNSSVKTLPVAKCSLLEHIHLQKFNYIDPYNSKDFWKENKKIKTK